MGAISGAGITYPSEAPDFTPVFSGVRATRSLVLYVCFVGLCLSFCTFSFSNCIVCSSSIHGFWLPLLYLQTLLRKKRRGNQEWTIQRNWQNWVHKTEDEEEQNKYHNTICIGHHYTQANTNNVIKAWALLQTTGGNYEPNIFLKLKYFITDL